MRVLALRIAALGLLALGLVLVGLSVASGEGQLYLLLFIPVFTSGGGLGLAGIAALFGGLILGMLTIGVPIARPSEAGGPPVEAPTAGTAPARPRLGGVVMLGPIPLVFGSDPGIARWMAVLGIVLLALTLAVFLLLVRT